MAKRKKVEKPKVEEVELEAPPVEEGLEEIPGEPGSPSEVPDSPKIMCIPTKTLWESLPYFEGHAPVGDVQFLDEHVTWIPRNEAENDPGYKQIIPYVLLVRDAANGNPASASVLVYSRAKTSGEKRLQGLRTCGFGGHIEVPDSYETGAMSAIEACVSRELDEELNFDLTLAADQVALGWINDDSNDVGRVHLGLVLIVKLPPSFGDFLPSSDEGVCDLRWQRLTQVSHDQTMNSSDWESWSCLAISAYCSSLSTL